MNFLILTLIKAGLVDEIVPEPRGGAHVNHEQAATLLDMSLSKALAAVANLSPPARLDARYRKWRAMGNSSLVEV